MNLTMILKVPLMLCSMWSFHRCTYIYTDISSLSSW